MTTGVGANSTGGVVVDCAQTAINAEVAGTSGQSAVENLENQSSTGIEQQNAKPKRPHEYTSGKWEVEPFYYSTTSSNSYNTNGTASPANNGSRNSYANGDDVTQSAKRNRRGMVYKSRDDYEYKCFQDYEGTIYRLGDHVYVDSLQPSDPYLVGCILMFKMTKKSDLLVKVSRFYRPDDVPEVSYSLIVQERKDLGHFDEATYQLQSRELFSSETQALHPISSLRGKCKVKVVKDIRFACSTVSSSLCLSSSVASPNSTAATTATVAESAAVKGPGNLELLKEADSFFTCLNYNQDSSRLAAVQGEIRVGGSFQAKLPPCSSSSISDEPDRDELLYRPGYICQETEQNYVKVVRAFRTFSLMNNKKITQLEKSARSGDLLFDDAVVTLHRCGYNVVEATKMMQELDQHLTSDSSFMSAEDVKKFGKGIKTYGKNFIKISKELVPLHQRDQLVGFYYLWKKSREATRPKPLRKNNMAAVGRRSNKPNNFSGNNNGNGGGIPRNSSSKSVLTALSTTDMEFVDYASASETEAEQLEDRACHHCYSSKSKDWHHAGRDRQLMCTECRLFYKKYGQLRPVDRPATVPPCLFKSARQSPSNYENEENDEPALGVRTRGAGRKEGRRGRTPTSMPLDAYSLEMKTPIKSELLENGAVFERRTTPQRTAKSNRKRPRASASGGDEITPTSKGKRAKVESRTPSPLTTADGLPSSGNEAENSKRSAKASSMSSTSSSCSGDNSLDDQIKREIGESMATTSGTEDQINMPNGVYSGEQSSGQTGKPTPKSAELGSKRPIAKVEPLDPNESAKRRNSPATQATTDMFNGGTTPQRKSGVVGTATKMLKFEHKKEVAEVKEEKCEQNPSTSTPTELENKSLLRVDGYEDQSNETADASAIGESVVSALPTSLVLKGDSEEKKKDRNGTTLEEYPNLRRHIKRSSGVTCARTDVGYVDSRTSEWQMKRAEVARKREQQQLLEQQQRDASAAAAAALSLAAASQHQQQQAHAQSHQPNLHKVHGAMGGIVPQNSQQMVRKPELSNHVDSMPPGSAPNSNIPMDINQALLIGAGRVPLNGVPVSAAAPVAGMGPGGMPLPPPPGGFPPNPNALAALHAGMAAQMDPRLAAFASPQQLNLMMLAGLEQQQKMEQMQRHQQQQQQQQQRQQQQQINGAINGAAHNPPQNMTPNSNKQMMPPANSMTPHMSSPMDAQRNAAAAAFMNAFSQHQQGQQQPPANVLEQQAQQVAALHHAAAMSAALGGNPFGIPTSAAQGAGNLTASQAAVLQSLMGERAAAVMEQQQRNNLLERFQLELMSQHAAQAQQHAHQQQQQQSHAAAAALAAAASSAQQQQQQVQQQALQQQHQQAMMMAAAGHPMAAALAGADPQQFQMFVNMVQQHQNNMIQQQQQAAQAQQQAQQQQAHQQQAQAHQQQAQAAQAAQQNAAAAQAQLQAHAQQQQFLAAMQNLPWQRM